MNINQKKYKIMRKAVRKVNRQAIIMLSPMVIGVILLVICRILITTGIYDVPGMVVDIIAIITVIAFAITSSIFIIKDTKEVRRLR